MLSIAFWNTNKKVGSELIAKLQRATDCDILILAECDLPTDHILSVLNNKPPREVYFRELYNSMTRVRGFTRLYSEMVTVSMESKNYFSWRLSLPGSISVLLFGVHLPSKLCATAHDQAFFVRALRDAIKLEEDAAGHENTLLIGDFNMSPFETGMSAFDGLHAVMDKRVAARGSRSIQGTPERFFYNPMWGLAGDVSRGPPGTYYYAKSVVDNHFWYMFDQVVLRPSLLKHFDARYLEVLTCLGDVPLLSGRGVIGPISDHLPLSIRMKPEES